MLTMLLLVVGAHWVNAWHGGSISTNETFRKSPFDNFKMVVYYYITN
jgi:hypothetical protein